jgi:hypothetical protein
MKTLKIKLFSALLCSLFFSNLHSTVWTVSNDASRPAQFTTIPAAVTAASPGDTLRIAGSNTQYEGVILYFPMTWIGEGANNPNGFSTRIGNLNLYRLNSSLGSSGSKFYGIHFTQVYMDPDFTGATVEQKVLTDITFERCRIEGQFFFNNAQQQKITNVFIRNCVFNGSLNLGGTAQNSNKITSIFTNCVFDGGSTINAAITNVLNGGVIIRNSLFLNIASPRFININGVIVENSIFYKSEPTGAINSVFNNNICYLANSNTIPYGNNAGSGNLINVNPLFVNYPPLGANFAWTHNYGLQVGSPAIGTGSNGTNIGLTGGNAPVNNIPGNSRIPVVTGLTLPTSSVPVGGTLEINIQAISRN